MSNSSFGSFNTNTEYNEPIWSSFGSSQSTQATDVSYTYPDPTFPQTGSTIGQNNLFKDIGYGATDALGGIPPNPNAGVRNVYGGGAPGPSPGLQSQNYVYRAEPWSPIASSQAYATYPYPPYPNVERTSTQRPGQLAYQPTGYYAYQNTSAMSPSASSDDGTGQDMRFYGQAQSPIPTQHSPSSSGQSDKLPLPKLQYKKPRAPSNGQTAKPRFPCPECDETFSRREDVQRHNLTRHTGKGGPFWRCDICGAWQYHVRLDRMRTHCREKHPEAIEVDLTTNEEILPYHQVPSVGVQKFDPGTSTDSMRTRRRKTPVK